MLSERLVIFRLVLILKEKYFNENGVKSYVLQNDVKLTFGTSF